MMEVKAIHRGARISAQKTRLVADQIRGLPVDKALNVLTFSPKKAAGIVKKVVLSASAFSAPRCGHRDELLSLPS